MTPENYRPPWSMMPAGWKIVGMNHYTDSSSGTDKPQLYVAMMKGGRCIVEEGPDECYLWNRLAARAKALADLERAPDV